MEHLRININRVLSTVLYLNPDWQSEDAGELVMYAPNRSNTILTVSPVLNRCMLFLSDNFPHEVLFTQAARYSIAGWFRVNGTVFGNSDPPR